MIGTVYCRYLDRREFALSKALSLAVKQAHHAVRVDTWLCEVMLGDPEFGIGVRKYIETTSLQMQLSKAFLEKIHIL